jgi:hypothetical protein
MVRAGYLDPARILPKHRDVWENLPSGDDTPGDGDMTFEERERETIRRLRSGGRVTIRLDRTIDLDRAVQRERVWPTERDEGSDRTMRATTDRTLDRTFSDVPLPLLITLDERAEVLCEVTV